MNLNQMEPKKIIVSGANGQLGRMFRKLAPQQELFEFYFYNSSELDITNFIALSEVFDQIGPFAFINCAAYTSVDKAESESERAYLINAQAPKQIAELCSKFHSYFIHYSTDYVYHILTEKALTEDDPTSPQGVYAKSKKSGEDYILASESKAIIIRTSWVYSEVGHNFLKTMVKLGNERTNIRVVNDQIGAPTYAGDIAAATMKIMSMLASKSVELEDVEILNYTSEGKVSWYDFAKYIFETAGMEVKLVPISTKEYPTPAQRPYWSVLDLSKIKRKYGIAPRYWKEAVKECLLVLP